MFSVVVPVYNEVRRIPKTIDQIFSFFQSSSESVEIIFVNDGSKDETEKMLRDFQKKYTFELVTYSENRGKGYAVRQGANHAKGEWILFFDIDLATPLSEFTHLLQTMSDTDRIVIGSRRVEGSAIKKSESKIRTFLGHGFTKLSNILVPGIKDFTCGFKAFRRDAAKAIFSRARIDRWGFDTELLYIAHIHKIPVRQMPVAWTHDDDSRVKVVQAVIRSAKELGEMFMNRVTGKYH